MLLVLKYSVAFNNLFNIVYVKCFGQISDGELISVLGEISCLSTKNLLSKAAINKLLLNSFFMDILLHLFTVKTLETL